MSEIPELRTTAGETFMAEEFDVEFKKYMVGMFDTKLEYPIFDPISYTHNETRNIYIVHPSKRKTSEIMGMFEYANVISIRAKQIENGAPIYVDIGGEIDPIKIAEMEVYQKKCPLSIRRMYDINSVVGEIWEVNEMIPPTFPTIENYI